jgi:hypothetical protein
MGIPELQPEIILENPPTYDFDTLAELSRSVILYDRETVRVSHSDQYNVINYLLTTLNFESQPTREQLLGNLYQAISDVHKAAIEKIKSAAVKKDIYDMQWEGSKLNSPYGADIETIIVAGIEDNSGQIPTFEKLRNIRNYEFFTKLKEARMRGDKKPMIEISACPDEYYSSHPALKEQAESRGYRGDSVISKYTMDENGVEHVEQFWFKNPTKEEWRDFIKNMMRENYTDATRFEEAAEELLRQERISDTDIMRLSGEMSERELRILDSFISEQRSYDGPEEDLLLNRLEMIVGENYNQKTFSLLTDAAAKLLIKISGEDDIRKMNAKNYEKAVNEIRKHIGSIMVAAGLFFREHGIDIFDPEVSKHLKDKTLREFINSGQTASDVGFAVWGCGFSDENKEGGSSSGGIARNIEDLFNLNWQNYLSLVKSGFPNEYGAHNSRAKCRCGARGCGACGLCVTCHLKAAA